MPQPSLITGVGATVEGGYKGPALGEQLVSMAEAFTRVKQAEQAQAMQKYKTMLDTATVLPIDAQALRKVAKKAGMPLPSDETIAAIAQVGKQQQGQAPDQGKPGDSKLPGGGAAPGPGMPNAKQQPMGGGGQNPDAAAAAAQKKWQDNMTPEQGLQHVLNTWYTRAQNLSKAKIRDEQARVEYNTHLTQLKDAALGGDKEAVGKMMGAAEIPFNITQLAWSNSTPEQKTTMYGIALGHETDAQKMERQTQIMNGLIHSGLSAADSYSAARAMASGQPLSPEMQKKMGAPTFDKLSKEAEFMNQAMQLGVPPDKVQGVATTAMQTGSLVGALPKGLQPVFQKELQIRQQALNLEKQRLGVEQTRATSEAGRVSAYEKKVTADIQNMQWKHEAAIAKLRLSEVTGENKEYLDVLKIAISQKKAGVELAPQDMQKMLDGLKAYTDDPQELFNYLSGQPTTVTPGGNPMDDELSDRMSQQPGKK